MEEKAWHEWRKAGLGSSDAAVVLGISPWKTRYQLWLEKTSQEEAVNIDNYAMARGRRLEPVARAFYEEYLNEKIPCPPAYFVHPTMPHLRASLDGWCPETQTILEIKAPGSYDHEKARLGQVPEKYLPQLQHLLLVNPEAKRVHYLSWKDENDYILLTVERDPLHQARLLFELDAFWVLVQKGIPPELSCRDMVAVENQHLGDWCDQLKAWQEKEREAKAAISEIKERILNHPQIKDAPHHVLINGYAKVVNITKKGSVRYQSYPGDVDWEQYRLPDTTFKKILI